MSEPEWEEAGQDDADNDDDGCDLACLCLLPCFSHSHRGGTRRESEVGESAMDVGCVMCRAVYTVGQCKP